MKGERTIEVWQHAYIANVIHQIPLNDAKFLLAGYFGTGARLEEFRCLKKKDFVVEDKDGTKVIKVTLPTFKNRKVHARTIHLFPAVEGWFTSVLLDWVNALPEPESKLFCKSGRWIEGKFKEWFGKHPHFFRHCRCTYNYNYWKMNDVENKDFMGWSDTQPAAIYTHLRDEDRMNAMLERIKAIK